MIYLYFKYTYLGQSLVRDSVFKYFLSRLRFILLEIFLYYKTVVSLLWGECLVPLTHWKTFPHFGIPGKLLMTMIEMSL